MMRSGATIKGSITASRKLHYQLLNKLVRLPMAFYDSQPTGASVRACVRVCVNMCASRTRALGVRTFPMSTHTCRSTVVSG